MISRFWKSNQWFGQVKSMLLIILAVTSFRSAIADWNHVPTGSMKPAILEGDRIVVNKLAYDLKVPFTNHRLASWDSPERFDIVVFFSPEDGMRLVKRVVGLPGDKIEMRRGALYINDEPAQYWTSPQGDVESFAEKRHPVKLSRPLGADFGPVVVSDGHFFVLGDNRDNSRDSRYFGLVPASLIAGKAEAVAVSLDSDAGYRPRAGRFLQPLP